MDNSEIIGPNLFGEGIKRSLILPVLDLLNYRFCSQVQLLFDQQKQYFANKGFIYLEELIFLVIL